MKIEYQNHQLYQECSLVALWNAARFHGIPVPVIGSDQYNQICKECCCTIGPCINIKKEIERLGLQHVSGKQTLRWIRNNLPVDITIRHSRKGFHAVLAIKAYKDKLLLANYAKNKLHWLTWKQIKQLIPAHARGKLFSYQL